MYPFGSFSKPYFKFFFPKEEHRDSFMGNVRSIDKFQTRLEELWYADEELWKFKYSLVVAKNQGVPMITCNVKKCKFGIRFTKIKQLYRINYFSNAHGHQFLQFSKFYQKLLDPSNNDYHIKTIAPLSYSVSKKGITPNAFPTMQLEKIIQQSGDEKPRVHITFDDEDYHQTIINQPQLQEVRNKTEIQIVKKKHFYGNNHQEYYERERAKQIEKKQIMKDAYIKIVRNRVIKEEYQEYEDSVHYKGEQAPQEKDDPIRIFYSSKAMQLNMKKWAKSVYIASIPYVVPNIPNFFIKKQYFFPVTSLVFMGIDQSMQVTIFAVGVSGGIQKHNDIERDDACQRMIEQFFQLVRLNSIRIQTIVVKQNDWNLFNILKGFTQRQPKQHNYILKKQINKRLIIHKKSIANPGIIFKLAYCLLYNRAYEADDEKREQFDVVQLTKIMQKGRKIQPILNKLCVALNPKVFGKLVNKFIAIHCKTDFHFQYFYNQFILKKDDYCLLTMEIENFANKNLEDIMVIDGEEDEEKEELKQKKIQQNGNNFEDIAPEIGYQEKKKVFPAFSQISASSVDMKFSCRSQKLSKIFEPSQLPYNSKEKQTRFMGFNLYIDCDQWIKSLAASVNLTQKMGESIIKDYQMNKLNSLPKTSAQLLFRELILLLNENKATFPEPDSQFWRNVGFPSFGSSAQHHKSMSKTLKSIPQSISFITDWDIQKYSQYDSQKHTPIQEQKTEQLLEKLPLYKISLIYFSKRAHRMILTYEILGMLEMNIYLVRFSEPKKIAPFAQIQTGTPDSILNAYTTPVTAFVNGQINPEKAIFIVGKQDIYETVSKKRHKWKCTCNFSDYMGMPCRHILKAFTLSEYSFADCISRFWKIHRKLRPTGK